MTVETAIVLPLLMLVLAGCLAGIACAAQQIRCIDAAREAARLAGRGDVDGARAAAGRLAGAGAVDIDVGDRQVSVSVSAAPLGSLLPGLRIGATSVAAVEGAIVAP